MTDYIREWQLQHEIDMEDPEYRAKWEAERKAEQENLKRKTLETFEKEQAKREAEIKAYREAQKPSFFMSTGFMLTIFGILAFVSPPLCGLWLIFWFCVDTSNRDFRWP